MWYPLYLLYVAFLVTTVQATCVSDCNVGEICTNMWGRMKPGTAFTDPVAKMMNPKRVAENIFVIGELHGTSYFKMVTFDQDFNLLKSKYISSSHATSLDALTVSTYNSASNQQSGTTAGIPAAPCDGNNDYCAGDFSCIVGVDELGSGYCEPATGSGIRFASTTFAQCVTKCNQESVCNMFAWHRNDDCMLSLQGASDPCLTQKENTGGDYNWVRYKSVADTTTSATPTTPASLTPKPYTKVFDGECFGDKKLNLSYKTLDQCHTECMEAGYHSFVHDSSDCKCERGTAWGAFDFNTHRGHTYPDKYIPYRCGDGSKVVQTGWGSFVTESYGTEFAADENYDKFQAYCPAGKHHFNMTHCAQCPAGKYRPDEWRVTDGGCDGTACMLITESGGNVGAGSSVCVGECDGGTHPVSSSTKSSQCSFDHPNKETIDCFQRQSSTTAARAPIPGCAYVAYSGKTTDWDYCYDTAIPEGNFNATECYDCPVGKNPTPTGDKCTVHPECISSETPLDGVCEYPTIECVDIQLPIEPLVLYMVDSFGDGWNSFYMRINGASKTLSGGRSGTTSIPSAATMVIAWQADGSYPSEVTWSLECQDGTVVASGSRYGPWGTFANPCPSGDIETQCTDSVDFCAAGMIYNNGCSNECADVYMLKEVVGYVDNDHKYCVKGSYAGSLRPYAGTDNPGTTFAEKREACFQACMNTNGDNIQDSVLGYQQSNFWEQYSGSDMTHFIMSDDTPGRCYCYTDGPSAAECAADGAVSYTGSDLEAYAITRTPVCSDHLCIDSPDPLTAPCSYEDYTCGVGDTYNGGACARNCSVGYVQSGEACGKCIGTSYQDEPGQTTCKDCSANEMSSPDGASCVCEPGTAGLPCEVCQAGKFVSEACEPCPDGQYQDEDGQSGCKECADGSFVNQENTTCTPCPLNTAMHDWGSGCPSWSTNDGCHCDCGNSGFGGTHCDVCGYGKGYNITMNRCEDCTFGYVNMQDSHTAACALLGCDEDYGYTSDIDWDPVNAGTNSSNCQECPIGSNSPAGDGQCVVTTCLENFYVWNYHCEPCGPNKTNAAGDSPYGPDTECDYTCGINEYYDTTPGKEKCTPCSVPHISDGTKDTCWHQASKYITDKTIHEAVRHPQYYDDHISTSAVTNMDGLFKGITISSGYLDRMKDWDVSSVTSMREMFLGAIFQDPGGPGKPFDPDDPDGLQWTIHSDVDNTRWKSPTVRYGLFNADADVIEVCPDMDVLVRWDTQCNIVEAESQFCDSVENEVVSLRVSGTLQIMDNLYALPGKRRFFRCSSQCSTAFEVFCNADYNIRQYCNSFVGTVNTVLGESCALSNSGLRSLIQKWTTDKIRIEEQHGPLSEWDVSYVTDMSELFKGNTKNPDIRKWDMSNVVHAELMFQNSTFTYSIDNKDFSSLQSANHMFDSSYTGRACGKHLSRAGAKGTLSSVGANGLSNCLTDTNMHTVAGEWWTDRVNAWNTYGHIDDWDVTEVTNMNGLFKNQLFTTESLSDWQTGNVITMYAMFENTNFNGDIRFWDVRQVTSFSRMFYNNAVFNYDLSRFEAFSKESTDMTNSRFYKENVLQLDELYKEEVSDIYAVYAQWKTDKSGIEEVYGPISEWMVHNVFNMSELFKDEDFNEDISHWVVSSVTDMSSMFEGSTFDQPIGGWSTVNVRNMSRMFKGTVFNQDIQLWNVTKVEDMTEMFANSVFSYSIGDWDLFATAADKIKAPREPDRCISGGRSSKKTLTSFRGDPSATRECYELCDRLVTTKRLDIEGRNRWRSWGRVIPAYRTNSSIPDTDDTTYYNFGIVTTSTENHTCTCLEEVGPISSNCEGGTTSEFQYVFQFRDMLDEGLFDGNTAYRQPMCGLGWRYRDLSSMSQAQLDSADTCNICGYEAHENYTSGHGQTTTQCGLCVGEFEFDYCRASPRSFTLEQLYDFGDAYFRGYGGSLVVDANGEPLPDYATTDEINAGYVNKFACNCMYKDGLQGCLVVNGRKQVRMAEWYVNGLTNFSDYVTAQGANMRYYCELDFLQGREVRFASGFNSVECTDDVLLDRAECELVGGDWDGSCSKCLEPCADPTTGVKEISLGRVCTECKSHETVFNNECVTCPNGKYTDENHAWCGKCPAGTRGVDGICISCVEDLVNGNWELVPGLFSSFEGAIRCETCSANTFSIGTECAQCPQGYISDASKSSCEESTLCYKGNTSDNQGLAGDYCVEDECIRGFKSKVVDGGFTCVSSCENGKFLESLTTGGEYCKCYDKWYGDDCNKCVNLYDYTLEDPPRCQERFCVDESKRDCICRNEYVRPLFSQTCIDGDLKEICKDGKTDCMCNIATGLEWTEHGICKNDTEKNIIVLECPVIEGTGLVIHPPEECFPGLRVNDFECETFRRTDVNGIGAMCDSICEKDDYENGARCCISYSWMCLEEMCNSTQYVHTPWVTGPADTEGCCLERELCSSYTSTCSNAGGKASRIDFASTRAVTFFANDTVFLDDCCYNYQYKVEKGWLGKRCDAGKDIETEEECDIAQATADNTGGTSMISWGTSMNSRCSAYEHFGSGGSYRDICRK